MRDLDAALPRVEVSDYRWADDGFELCITLPLGEPVPREQARRGFSGGARGFARGASQA